MPHRKERVGHTIQRELGVLISDEVRDPRLPPFTSVTKVECSPDLKEARVFISVLGSQEKRAPALAALVSASGMLRRELALRMRMRVIPKLEFRLDTTIEEAADVLKLMDRVAGRARRKSGGA
jgi:ribosome-binding factor A